MPNIKLSVLSNHSAHTSEALYRVYITAAITYNLNVTTTRILYKHT